MSSVIEQLRDHIIAADPRAAERLPEVPVLRPIETQIQQMLYPPMSLRDIDLDRITGAELAHLHDLHTAWQDARRAHDKLVHGAFSAGGAFGVTAAYGTSPVRESYNTQTAARIAYRTELCRLRGWGTP